MKPKQITVKVGRLYRDKDVVMFVTEIQPEMKTTGGSIFSEQVLYYELRNPNRIIGDSLAYAERVWENVY